MTPRQEYYNLIAKYRARDPKELTGQRINRHHIKPKSLDGSDNPSNLVLVTYLEHLYLHQLLVKFTKDIALRKMQSALGMFYDKSGKLFTAEQYEEICLARSDAWKGKPGANRGLNCPDISKWLNENHPAHRKRFKGPTELWRAYDISDILLRTGVSANTEQRFFGCRNKPGWRSWGGSGGNVCRWPWFKKYHHHDIVIYSTRKEALAAQKIANEKEKPKYQKQLGKPDWQQSQGAKP